jgi:hypothetical protein
VCLLPLLFLLGVYVVPAQVICFTFDLVVAIVVGPVKKLALKFDNAVANTVNKMGAWARDGIQ